MTDKIHDAEFVEAPKPRTLTETEAFAVELVNVPSALVGELFDRLGRAFPRHEKVLAREPTSGAERAARYLFDFERGAPLPRRDGTVEALESMRTSTKKERGAPRGRGAPKR